MVKCCIRVLAWTLLAASPLSAQLVPDWAQRVWCLSPVGDACWALDLSNTSPFVSGQASRNIVVDVYGGFISLPEHYQFTGFGWAVSIPFESGTLVSTRSGARVVTPAETFAVGSQGTSQTRNYVPPEFGGRALVCDAVNCSRSRIDPDAFRYFEVDYVDGTGVEGAWRCSPGGSDPSLRACATLGATATVPEPDALWLILIGLVALVVRKRAGQELLQDPHSGSGR